MRRVLLLAGVSLLLPHVLTAGTFQTYASGLAILGDGFNSRIGRGSTMPADLNPSIDFNQTQGSMNWVDSVSSTIGGLSYAATDGWSERFTPSPGGPDTTFSWSVGGNVVTTASAELGRLHSYVYTYGHLSDLSQSIQWTDSESLSHNETRYNPFDLLSRGIARTGWRDTFTVNSSTLPAGTPVIVRLTLQLHSDVTPSDTAEAYASSALWLWSPYASSPMISIRNDGETGGGPRQQADMTTLEVNVGDSFGLEGLMEVGSQAAVRADLYGNGIGDRLNYANVADTANFYVEVLDARASVTSASGVSYAVPEPSTLGVLGTAVLLLLRRKP